MKRKNKSKSQFGGSGEGWRRMDGSLAAAREARAMGRQGRAWREREGRGTEGWKRGDVSEGRRDVNGSKDV